MFRTYACSLRLSAGEQQCFLSDSILRTYRDRHGFLLPLFLSIWNLHIMKVRDRCFQDLLEFTVHWQPFSFSLQIFCLMRIARPRPRKRGSTSKVRMKDYLTFRVLHYRSSESLMSSSSSSLDFPISGEWRRRRDREDDSLSSLRRRLLSMAPLPIPSGGGVKKSLFLISFSLNNSVYRLHQSIKRKIRLAYVNDRKKYQSTYR